MFKDFFSNKSKALEKEIDLYLNCISEAAEIFNAGVQGYFKGTGEVEKKYCLAISKIEREADDYLKDIKYKLYAFMLIPDSRADVFELLDAMDDLVDIAKQSLLQLAIEKPQVPEFLRQDFLAMSKVSMRAVAELVHGVRSFFRGTRMVESHVFKVFFYEKEADRIEEQSKRALFASSEIKHLSCKIQIRGFIEKIALPSDKAEEIAKNLLIYAVKRSI